MLGAGPRIPQTTTVARLFPRDSHDSRRQPPGAARNRITLARFRDCFRTTPGLSGRSRSLSRHLARRPARLARRNRDFIHCSLERGSRGPTRTWLGGPIMGSGGAEVVPRRHDPAKLEMGVWVASGGATAQPADFEWKRRAVQESPATAGRLNGSSLRKTRGGSVSTAVLG